MPLESPSLPQQIWASRYRYTGPDGCPEATIEATWDRVATAVASVETVDQARHRDQFRQCLSDFRFLPGGRILAGAGTDRDVTLFNCFAMGPVPDDLDGLFAALAEGARTLQAGGGVGYDFSTLAPRGSTRDSPNPALGPVAAMRIWNTVSDGLMASGARRGAMIATLRCDHPDIVAFIEAKHRHRDLEHFNLSVLVTDAFMAAVAADAPWDLVHPRQSARLPGAGADPADHSAGTVVATVSARGLWERLLRAAYDSAEPGVLFVDTLNRNNNLSYREVLTTTNPCGEIPLPPYGACNLGSINLTRFVHAPFTADAQADFAALADTATTAVRFLDNVIDLSRYPLVRQRDQALGTRRIGLGITGLADALILLGLRYDSAAGREMAARLMATVCHAAYRASIELAREKGPFPWLDPAAHVRMPFIQRLPRDIQDGIAQVGIRNSHLTAIAPCGTISLLAGNVSSGMEPVFAVSQQRRVHTGADVWHDTRLEDAACHRWRQQFGDAPLPTAVVTAAMLVPEDHLLMQAALQVHVDNAISKTINVPTALPFADFSAVYARAHTLGLKGCTVYRPNPIRPAIVSASAADTAFSVCCHPGREGD